MLRDICRHVLCLPRSTPYQTRDAVVCKFKESTSGHDLKNKHIIF